MFIEFGFMEIFSSLTGLLSQIGLALLALGAWKFFLMTRRKTWLVMLCSIGVSLALSLFWWGTSMLWGILPFLGTTVSALYDNLLLMNSLSLLSVGAEAAIYLSLAWEFIHQLRQHPAATTDLS